MRNRTDREIVQENVLLTGSQESSDSLMNVFNVDRRRRLRFSVSSVQGEKRRAVESRDEQDAVRPECQSACGFHLRFAWLQARCQRLRGAVGRRGYRQNTEEKKADDGRHNRDEFNS